MPPVPISRRRVAYGSSDIEELIAKLFSGKPTQYTSDPGGELTWGTPPGNNDPTMRFPCLKPLLMEAFKIGPVMS